MPRQIIVADDHPLFREAMKAAVGRLERGIGFVEADSVAAMLATQGGASLPNVPLALYQGATSFPLIAIPLFILAAAIMNTSGISHRLIDFCQALVGWVRGALAQVNVLSHMFFAEISGSDAAVLPATIVLCRIGFCALRTAAIPPPVVVAELPATVDDSIVNSFSR